MRNISAIQKILGDRAKSMKGSTGVSIGFHDPKTWVSTGSYALNYRLSGYFDRGIPLGKVSMFSGESGSGKSFLVSGNIVRDAQKQGIFVVLVDTENALDESWLKQLGVDTSPDKLVKWNMAMIDELAKQFAGFVKDYRSAYDAQSPKDREENPLPKVLFVIDSLGMLMTPTQTEQFNKGDMKGDMGRKPRQLKEFVTNAINMLGELEIGMVCTNHTYKSQDMFSPDDVVSGGGGFVYAASLSVVINKLKLKKDEDGNKTTTVNGIRAKCNVAKTRYNKPFEVVEIEIPYETGMNVYSGLFDMFLTMGLLEKSGNRYKYIDIDSGEEILKWEKDWQKNSDDGLELIMAQFHRNPLVSKYNSGQVNEENIPADYVDEE